MILTVFTPTYNRGYTLKKCYDSLIKQTVKDFKWLIVDDGSTDNTRELVSYWLEENKIKIEYLYQENQGVAIAHETAILNITTELNVCIDSDDYMPYDGVEKILDFWSINKSEDIAGFIGLDAYQKNNEIIGDRFPKNLQRCTFSDMTEKYKIKGDKKVVNRTELCKKHLPYPRHNNEKFPAVSYLYLQINKEKKYLLCNEVFCLVEYLPDGISMNKNKQYKLSPNGFIDFRKEKIECAPSFQVRMRHSIHLVSSYMFAGRLKEVFYNNHKLTMIISFPFGLILFFYIKYSGAKTFNKNLNEN